MRKVVSVNEADRFIALLAYLPVIGKTLIANLHSVRLDYAGHRGKYFKEPNTSLLFRWMSMPVVGRVHL